MAKASPTGSSTRLCVGWIWRGRPSWRCPRCPFYAKACGSFKSCISRGCWAPSTFSQHSGNLTAHCVVVSMYHSLLSKTLFKLEDQCSLKTRFKRTSFPLLTIHVTLETNYFSFFINKIKMFIYVICLDLLQKNEKKIYKWQKKDLERGKKLD